MIRSLSPREALVVLPFEERGQAIVTLSDIVSLLKCDWRTAYYIAYRLVEKQWLFRIKPGKYLFIPACLGLDAFPEMNPYICALILREPYYFSYYTAASHYGWTEQLSDVFYVATLHQQNCQVPRIGITVKPVRIAQHKLFGFTSQRVFSTEVNMASKEKAVVDAVDKPHLTGGIENVAKTLVRAKRQVDWELVIDYAKKMQSKSLCARLGYLLEKLSIVDGRLIDALALLQPSCYVHLGNPKRWGRRGKINKEWHIIENVPHDKLLSEVTIR
jgi:predicted transcriptional regulator of viral defense system